MTFLITYTSPKRKPEVDLRHLQNGYDVIIWYADRESHADDERNVKVEPAVEFQYGGRLFLKTGNSNIYSQPQIELSWRNLVCE